MEPGYLKVGWLTILVCLGLKNFLWLSVLKSRVLDKPREVHHPIQKIVGSMVAKSSNLTKMKLDGTSLRSLTNTGWWQNSHLCQFWSCGAQSQQHSEQEFIQSFIHHTFIEHLLCSEKIFKCWRTKQAVSAFMEILNGLIMENFSEAVIFEQTLNEVSEPVNKNINKGQCSR